MAAPIFDHVDDTTRKLTHSLLAACDTLPEYIRSKSQKQASDNLAAMCLPLAAYPDTGETAPHRDSFLDVSCCKYPCHTKEATFASALFFEHSKSQYPATKRAVLQRRLQSKLAAWDIEADVTATQRPKTADNEPTEQYPLRNAAECAAAHDWLLSNREILPAVERRKLAARICDAADDFDLILGSRESMEKLACRGFCDLKKTKKAIRSRIKYAKDTHSKDGMQKLLDTIREEKQASMELRTRISDTLDAFDSVYKLRNKYAANILDHPEDCVTHIAFTQAKELLEAYTVIPDGRVLKIADILNTSLADIEAVAGEEIRKQICTGLRPDPAKIAKLLPSLDAATVDGLVSVFLTNPE